MLLLDARNKPNEVFEAPSLGSKAKNITAVTMDLSSQVYGGFSLTDTLEYAFGTEALRPLSWTACLAIGPGATSTIEGYKKAKLSGRVQDLKGQALGWLQCVRGAIRTGAASFCIIPATAIDIALFFTTSKTALVASEILRGTGESLFGAASFLLLFSALIFIAHSVSFRQRVLAAEDDRKALKMLQQEPTYNLLYAMGTKGVETVQEASVENAKEVIETVLQENTKQILISLLYATICICGVGLTIASSLTISGPMLLHIAIMDSCLGFICLIADSVGLYDSLDDENGGTYDQAWLRFTFLFCSSILVVSVLIATSQATLAASAVLGILILIVHLLYFVKSKEEQEDSCVQPSPLCIN